MCEEARAAREEEGLRGSVQWVGEGGVHPESKEGDSQKNMDREAANCEVSENQGIFL